VLPDSFWATPPLLVRFHTTPACVAAVPLGVTVSERVVGAALVSAQAVRLAPLLMVALLAECRDGVVVGRVPAGARVAVHRSAGGHGRRSSPHSASVSQDDSPVELAFEDSDRRIVTAGKRTLDRPTADSSRASRWLFRE